MQTDKLESLELAGQIASLLHHKLKAMVKPKTNVLDLELFAKNFIAEHKVQSAFLGYKNYPAVLCVSINDEIVHAIPKNYLIKSGDVVSIDLGISVNGWMVDTAKTYLVQPSNNLDDENLLKVTEKALELALPYCRPGFTTGDIGAIIEQTITEAGFAIVKELHGHGVGKTLQEPPTVSNYGVAGKGTALKKGMVLAIEPITCLKETEIEVASDGWTIIAKNGCSAAHFEHTVIVDDSPVVLTL